jgi:hypothetical protein
LYRQSRISAASYWPSTSARFPTATMSEPRMATAPSRMMRRSPSIVMTVPPDSKTSTFSFIVFLLYCSRQNNC